MSSLESFELVLFGGLGDLATRKLLPALYLLEHDARLGQGSILVITRQTLSQEAFIDKIHQSVTQFVPLEWQDKEIWQRFIQRLVCVTLDVKDTEKFTGLVQALAEQRENRIFYLATDSILYAPICAGLQRAGLIQPASKLVLEKPIGHNYASATEINTLITAFFKEEQIYRIDHYLGKETVQNLMVLRFANSIFEHQWNQKYIDHIQITIGETLGVEDRADFYDHVGAMRDVFQNHLLQLLCITAMEPPASLDPDAIRDEKIKVLKALKPFTPLTVSENVVCGQYEAGVANGIPVPKYRDEPNIGLHSTTETFVAAKVEIENWRWAGVPFYLRTGKRLAERLCEIVVVFKAIPHSIFPLQHKNTLSNKLIFRLQPDEGIRMQLCEKRIGPGMNVRPINLSLNPAGMRKTRIPDAYERLLHDAISSNPTLFLRQDELLAAWQWIDPVLAFWEAEEQRPEPYTSGTWGPAAATLLLARDGRLWNENN